MATSFHLSPRPKDNGEHPIRIDIHHNGRARPGVGISIHARHWDEKKGRVKIGHPRHVEYNSRLSSLLVRVDAVIDADPTLKADEVWKRAQRRSVDSAYLSDALTLAIDHAPVVEATRVIMHGAVARAKAHIPDARMGALTVAQVKAYRRGIEAEGLHQNTVRLQMRMLRRAYNLAAEDMNLPPTDAFRKQIPAEIEAMPRDTELEVVQRIAVEPFAGVYDWGRDTWMLSLYLGGARIGKLLEMGPENLHNGGVLYRPGKKKDEAPIWMPLLPQAQAIIDKYKGGQYLLPWLDRYKMSSANAKINEVLKVVSARCGGPEGLSMHYARHACTAYLLSLSVPLDVVQMILSHSNIQQTINYSRKFDRARVTEAMAKVADAIAGSGTPTPNTQR